ncbi:hypothetical protein B0H13DRAFT_1463286, partial [Mycena leptocephala]
MAQWNFTILDTSPILSYCEPTIILHLSTHLTTTDGFGLQNGWQTWYTVSGFNKHPGDSSQGDSFHLTSLNGAEVSLQFYGSALYLYGTANASYEVTFDNSTQSFSGTTAADLLYLKEGLVEKNHTAMSAVCACFLNPGSIVAVTLRAKPSNATEQIGFSRAIVSTSTGLSFTTTPTAYSGNWISKTVQGIPNDTVTAPFYLTVDAGASVRVNVRGAVAVALYASTNWGHQLYSVSLDNAVSQIYNASTFGLVTNTVIFFQSGLDPDRMYAVNVINLSGGATLSLSSATAYQIMISGTSSHYAKIGAIVGPIVGVLILSLIAAFCWLRARKRR